MGYETLLLEKQGYVAVLTLNRPPTNSVSYVMLQELDKVFDEVVQRHGCTSAGDNRVPVTGASLPAWMCPMP